jgi:formylglycine-generating enzyme required for sulfatase activity
LAIIGLFITFFYFTPPFSNKKANFYLKKVIFAHIKQLSMGYINHLPIGTILKEQYQIERPLSSGGFGITYLARHTLITNKQFVIKEFFLSGVCIRVADTTVQPETARTHQFEIYKGKFLDEAKTIAQLPDDPHLIKVVDFFYAHNTAYMVMAYIEGVDLERFVREKPRQRLPETEALNYVQQVAHGLQLAHQKKILHRDIKPANLMRQPNGQIVIIDFGAARDFIAQDMVQTMTPIYTPGYAPLEQYSSRGQRGDYTDVYALGATLYRLLTGEKPMDALSRLHAPLSAPRSLNPAISEATNGLVLKMMEQHSKDRFQTIQSFLNALDAPKSPPVQPESPVIEIEIEIEDKTYDENNVPPKKDPIKSVPIPPKPKVEQPNGAKSNKGWIAGALGVIGISLAVWLNQKPSTNEPVTTTTKPVRTIIRTTPTHAPAEATTQQSYEPEMVTVEGGTFQMGSNDGESDEKPVHSVTLNRFAIGKYEVTQAEWRAVMGSDPSELNFKGCDKCPVERVSWNDVQDFLKKLNSKTSKNYRLPTEAEWEYAARGGKRSKGSKYSGSNDLNSVAWHDGNSGNQTHSVGGKSANELGIHDMSGNVWEWCSDWKGDYSSAAVTNPTGAATGAYRVMRGGSWFNTASNARLASRSNYSPTTRLDNLGFRVVLLPL